MRWNEARHMLTIGRRTGSFPGMLQSRTFQVVKVSPKAAVGFRFDPMPVKTVQYTGEVLNLLLP
jgi:alpha-D-xyloside xylohydrolase